MKKIPDRGDKPVSKIWQCPASSKSVAVWPTDTMLRFAILLFLLTLQLADILPGSLPCQAAPAATGPQKQFRIALMMDNDSLSNLKGRDNIMAELNNRPFQKSLGWHASFSYVQDAIYIIEPTPANLGLIDAAARTLMAHNDIDLIMTFCTEAAKALVRHNNNRTPIFLASGEDPVEAGLTNASGRSEIKNLFISFHSDVTIQNIKLLKMHVKNMSMGVIYEESANGELRARLSQIKKVCDESNIQLMTIPMPDSSFASCSKAVASLAEQKPDIFYAGSQKCLRGKHLPELLKPMTDRGIPTIGESEDQAMNGAMLTFSLEQKAREKQDAQFIISILSNGMIFNQQQKLNPKIILNLSVAASIGFDPSYALLATADKLVWDIKYGNEPGQTEKNSPDMEENTVKD